MSNIDRKSKHLFEYTYCYEYLNNVRFLPLGNENRSSISSSICGRVDDVLLSTPSSSNSALLDFNQTTLPELDNAEDKPDLLQLIVDEEIKQFF